MAIRKLPDTMKLSTYQQTSSDLKIWIPRITIQTIHYIDAVQMSDCQISRYTTNLLTTSTKFSIKRLSIIICAELELHVIISGIYTYPFLLLPNQLLQNNQRVFNLSTWNCSQT